MKRAWTHIVTGGPWPDRIGLPCRVVEPPEVNPRTYPYKGKLSSEVVILISGDPLTDQFRDPAWSCVLDRTDITPRPETTA